MKLFSGIFLHKPQKILTKTLISPLNHQEQTPHYPSPATSTPPYQISHLKQYC